MRRYSTIMVGICSLLCAGCFGASSDVPPPEAAPVAEEQNIPEAPSTGPTENAPPAAMEAAPPEMPAAENETVPALMMDQQAPDVPLPVWKTVTVGPVTFEIPEGWQVNDRIDTPPAPMPPEGVTTMDPAFIRLSFAEQNVSYEGVSWNQVDLLLTEDGLIGPFMDRLRNDPGVNDRTDHWETQMIGGEEAQVQVLKRNPDGTVDPNATGGAFSYFPSRNLIIHKQVFGDQGFEAGFDHFLQTLRFQ